MRSKSISMCSPVNAGLHRAADHASTGKDSSLHSLDLLTLSTASKSVTMNHRLTEATRTFLVGCDRLKSR